MNTKIYKDFTFEAAHFLPNVPQGHKCGRLHGHSYKIRLHFVGEVDSTLGWFIDFADVKSICNPILDILDHHLLNEIEGLSNPTAENIAKWIYEKLNVQHLHSVEVMETCTCGVLYPWKG